MISTVAVGTDGSETASRAVEVAADMARRYDAKLVLLSAFTSSGRAPVTLSGSAREVQWTFSPAARLNEQLERTEAELRENGLAAAPWSTRAIRGTCWCAWPSSAASTCS